MRAGNAETGCFSCGPNATSAIGTTQTQLQCSCTRNFYAVRLVAPAVTSTRMRQANESRANSSRINATETAAGAFDRNLSQAAAARANMSHNSSQTNASQANASQALPSAANVSNQSVNASQRSSNVSNLTTANTSLAEVLHCVACPAFSEAPPRSVRTPPTVEYISNLPWPNDIFLTCLVQVGVASCSCLAGFYGDPSRGIQCESCGANAMSRGGANLELASCFCSHGFYGIPNGTSRAPACRRCPSNSSTPASLEKNSSIADCECNRGYYGNPGAFDGVSQACTPCPPNTFNNATGAFLASACTACAPGFASPAASVAVTQCTPVASSDQSCPANSTCR